MRTTDQAKQARRLFLELGALDVTVKHRPHPDKPGETQLGLEWPRSLPNERGYALRERVRAIKTEMISLVVVEPQAPDAKADVRAVLQEGAA